MVQQRPVSEAFLRAHTCPARSRLVPEIVLYTAADVVALWEAIEAYGGTTGLDPPFWAAAWPGGQVLARYLLDHPEVVAGRTVLDLGSGSGLVAIAASLAGAAVVVASDVDPYARAVIALNATANHVTDIQVVADVLGPSPGSDTDSIIDAVDTVDVVVAGDVCYDRAMTARVLPFLGAARARGATVLLGDPGRAYLPGQGLEAVATHDAPDVGTGPRDTTLRRATVWRWP